MVCDDQYLKPRVTSVYMAGILFGSLISGVISDRFGRFPAFIAATYLQFLFMLLNIFSVSPAMYAALMFCAGSCSLVNFVAAIVLSAEMIETKRRAFVETAVMLGFSAGYIMLPLFAYFIVDWKWLMFSLGITGVLFLPYWWLMPESPRWLITKGKFEKARKLLKEIAKKNRAKVDTDTLFSEENLQLLAKNDEDAVVDTRTDRYRVCGKTEFPYLDLFVRPGMLLRTLCTCFSWFVISFAYYTMSLNTGNLGGNDFVNCFLSAAMEIPAYIIVYLILRTKGRRTLMIGLLFLSGVTCAVTPLLAKASDIAAIVSAMIGKFLISSVFSLVYLYTAELFPTEGRNQGLGISSMCARVGSVIAPYVIFLGEKVSGDLPYVITGALAFAASASNILLPETMGEPLPDTYEEAAQLKRQPFLPCGRKKDDEKKTKSDEIAVYVKQ